MRVPRPNGEGPPSLLCAGAPAGEPASLSDRSETFFGVQSLVLRCHDEQLIAGLDPFPAVWKEGPVVADDQGHHGVLGKPKLAYFDTDQARLNRDADLQQIGRDLVEWRDLDLHILSRLVIDQPEPTGDEGQRRTLQAGEDDDEDQHDIEKGLCPRDFLSEWNRGQHDRHGSAQARPGKEHLMPGRNLEPHRTRHDRGGAGDKRQEKTCRNRDQGGTRRHPVWEGQQAEHDEEADLGDPANSFHEGAGRGPVRQLGIPEDQRAHVHGRKPAGVDERAMPYAKMVQTRIASG